MNLFHPIRSIFFKVLCIIPNKEFAKVKYKIPKNVVEIKNIYMDPYLNFFLFESFKGKYAKKWRKGKKYRRAASFPDE